MAAKRKSKKMKKSKAAGKRAAAAKPASKKRAAARKPAAKKKSAHKSRKPVAAKASATKKTVRRGKPERTASIDKGSIRSRSGLLSGDLQGISNSETANSESIDELLEEGNAFEASVVSGVERAEDAGEKEVHTHEVPEDDVPEEYQNPDKP